MAEIDLMTCVSRGSVDYMNFMYGLCERLKSGKHKINYKCVISVGAENDNHKFEIMARTGDSGHNSLNHAIALNESLKHFKSKYCIIIDADVAILYKNWDEVIVNELNNNDCFGFSYHKDFPKYQKFPTVYLFAFDKKILKSGIDFSPKISAGIEKVNSIIIDNTNSKIFNLPVGCNMKCDTGWMLPYLKKNFTGSSLECVHLNEKNRLMPISNSQMKICMDQPTHMAEWHYNGKIFGTHKQASRNHPINGPNGKVWVDRINSYLRDNKI